MYGFGWNFRTLTEAEYRYQLWLQGVIRNLSDPLPKADL